MHPGSATRVAYVFTLVRHLRFALPAIGGCLLFAASVAGAAETVVVHTLSGRVLTGEIDAQSTADELLLRMTAPGIVAMTGVRWTEIVRVEFQEQSYTADAFRPLAERLKSPLPKDFFVKTPAEQLAEAERAAAAARENAIDRRVRSLAIDAYLANWDQDAEVDGLELRIYPLNADRNIVPVNGIVTTELIGQRYLPEQLFEPIREPVSLIEKWTSRVDASRFNTDGTVVRLPFRNNHPEFDLAIRYFGQVNAKLNIRGQGTYDATVPVTLRTFSPLREQLQFNYGTRFFPGERTRFGW
jgi:hypothetical protein